MAATTGESSTAAAGVDGATAGRAAGRASTARAASTGKAAAYGASTPSVRHDNRGGEASRKRDRGSLARPLRAVRSNVLAAAHRDIASELTHGPFHRKMPPQGQALSDAQRLPRGMGITIGKQEGFPRRIASHQNG